LDYSIKNDLHFLINLKQIINIDCLIAWIDKRKVLNNSSRIFIKF